MFDWPSFLQQNNVYFATSGPNVSRGNCVIHCPWCGNADDSQHLVINLNGQGFKCWRDRSHAGKNPARLIQALLNCSWEQAATIAGQGKALPNDFMNKVKSSLVKQEIKQKVNDLQLPKEFKSFSSLPSCKPYLRYIEDRGFKLEYTKPYDVYYASQGLYKGRVIFAVYDKEGCLTGWTGRTIYDQEMIRYKTLTHDLEKAQERGEVPAPNPISHHLLFYDRIVDSGVDTIVLCEGPFDAWRVNVLGELHNIVATCFFTSSLSVQQLNLLHELLPNFVNRYLLLDENTFSKAGRIKSDLISLGVQVKRLPQGIKDPGLIKTSLQLKAILS